MEDSLALVVIGRRRWWVFGLMGARTKREACEKDGGKMPKLRIALALGSGGLRGITHIGVLRALAEAGSGSHNASKNAAAAAEKTE